MHPEFWHERWQAGQIGFHEAAPNPMLVAHDAQLGAKGTVFVPLCGKSRDLAHLAELGHHVVGIELSRLAAEAFFAESGMQPLVTQRGPYEVFEANGVAILVGDVFALRDDPSLVPPIQAIYDRAALVALPPDMQARYAELLVSLLPSGGHMLLVAFDYDQTAMSGPPFSVPRARVDELYAQACTVEELASRDIGGEQPRFPKPMLEIVYLLTKR